MLIFREIEMPCCHYAAISSPLKCTLMISKENHVFPNCVILNNCNHSKLNGLSWVITRAVCSSIAHDELSFWRYVLFFGQQ